MYEPEIPGKIIAIIAMNPAKKRNKGLSGVLIMLDDVTKYAIIPPAIK